MIIDPCWVSLLEIWLLNVSRLKFLKEYFFHFIQRYYDNQELDIFRTQFCKKSQVFFPFGWTIITWSNQLQFIPPLPEQLLWGGGDEAIISDGGKKGLKDTYLTSGLIWWRFDVRTLKLFSRIILDKPYNNQSFPYKNHCKHYKKVASRLRPMLFTLTKFFLKHTLSSSEGK